MFNIQFSMLNVQSYGELFNRQLPFFIDPAQINPACFIDQQGAFCGLYSFE